MKASDGSEIVPGAIIGDAELDDLAGLPLDSLEFRQKLTLHMARRAELDELREIARASTRTALEAYEQIPPDWSSRLTLKTRLEGDVYVFELFVVGDLPGDAIVLASARVNQFTKKVKVVVTNLSQRPE